MKVTCVKGSPRTNGNSSTITQAFLNELNRSGVAEITTFELNKLNYKGCQECLQCNTKLDKCAINDDLTDVLESVGKSDVLVISSSVFYGDVTSQTKGFIDRMYSFRKYDYENLIFTSRLKGKRLVMILAQAHPDENMFADIFPRYDYFFNDLGFTNNLLIRACGLFPTLKPTNENLEQARNAAQQIINAA
jgi:multimeric flavodoxin WrbA